MSDQEAPDFSRMFVSAGYDAPDTDTFTVYHTGEIEVPDVGTFTAHIIGSSHYIHGGGYHEVMSCFEPGMSAREFDITGPLRETVNGRLLTQPDVHVHSFPLSAFPDDEIHDVAYKFGPDAWTTVDETRTGWETWHTYPELGVAVWTETVFE